MKVQQVFGCRSKEESTSGYTLLLASRLARTRALLRSETKELVDAVANHVDTEA